MMPSYPFILDSYFEESQAVQESLSEDVKVVEPKGISIQTYCLWTMH